MNWTGSEVGMMNREKIIKGLEMHEKKRTGVGCLECPYAEAEGGTDDWCIRGLHRDILALLKEQEARVVTTADFENNPNLDDSYHLNVWEEYRDGTRCGWNTININDVITFTDIHRYWTSRPTDKQRQAVKWK